MHARFVAAGRVRPGPAQPGPGHPQRVDAAELPGRGGAARRLRRRGAALRRRRVAAGQRHRVRPDVPGDPRRAPGARPDAGRAPRLRWADRPALRPTSRCWTASSSASGCSTTAPPGPACPGTSGGSPPAARSPAPSWPWSSGPTRGAGPAARCAGGPRSATSRARCWWKLDRIVLKAAGPTTALAAAPHKRPPSRQPTTHPADPTPDGTRSADPRPPARVPPIASRRPGAPRVGDHRGLAAGGFPPRSRPPTRAAPGWCRGRPVSGVRGWTGPAHPGRPAQRPPRPDARRDAARRGGVRGTPCRAGPDRGRRAAAARRFTLVRRLAAQPPMPALTIVTSAAQQVSGDESIEPGQAALWGLARTLRIERRGPGPPRRHRPGRRRRAADPRRGTAR